MRASLTASYVTKKKVQARLFSPDLSVERLNAGNTGTGGSTFVSFSDSSNVELMNL